MPDPIASDVPDVRPAGPFSRWERMVAGRYLRSKRREGGVAMIGVIAYVGIALAVAVLIIVMSVMNGFRTELLSRILGFNGHVFVASSPASGLDTVALTRQLSGLPGVVQAAPVIEGQVMAVGDGQVSGAIVRGVSRASLRTVSPPAASTAGERASTAATASFWASDSPPAWG
jgi:lipoprotein-releasing system permease protein